MQSVVLFNQLGGVMEDGKVAKIERVIPLCIRAFRKGVCSFRTIRVLFSQLL